MRPMDKTPSGGTVSEFVNAARTAIEYEVRMRALYVEASQSAKDESRRKIFLQLAEDEGRHVAILKKHLKEWVRDGQITGEGLRSALPDQQELRSVLARVRQKLHPDELENELAILRKAFAAETESMAFFRRLVDHLKVEDQKQLFREILVAEETHLSIVKAELDYATSGKGGWIDPTTG
jgi:rubrerythrin